MDEMETDEVIIARGRALTEDLQAERDDDEWDDPATGLEEEVREQGELTLALEGYDDDISMWGWNEEGGYLFAHLWREEDGSDDPPAISITPSKRWPATADIQVLAGYISSATGADVPRVIKAMCGDDENDDGYLGTRVTITEHYDLPPWPPHGPCGPMSQ